MIKETYQIDIQETSCNIAMSQLDSIRKKTITRTGYRVYQDGLIGVHGQLGQTRDDPWAMANDNLANRVAYPFQPVQGVEQTRLIPAGFDETLVVAELESVLADIRSLHPDFNISNKVNMTRKTITLANDQGTRLVSQDNLVQVALLLKHQDSVNIMDTFVSFRSRTWDRQRLLNELDQMMTAYKTVLPMPDTPVYVVAEADMLASKLISELNGEKVGYKSSLLLKDFGKQAFNPAFSFYLDWDADEQLDVPFFDAEGTIMPDGRVDLISRGVIDKAYTDKRTAEQFKMPLTGSAACPYDGVPSLGARNFNIDRSSKTVRELLDGRLGVIIVIASGGDYTQEGRFASPVQMSLLTDGERLLGRLPEFNISGELYDLFGKGYIGYSQDRFLSGEHALVVDMTIKA